MILGPSRGKEECQIEKYDRGGLSSGFVWNPGSRSAEACWDRTLLKGNPLAANPSGDRIEARMWRNSKE
ncbi:hypothetical protein HPP92_000362 [Vanilla planifolia]|uniref:Uncharacterized protein n=1 Tax=Vanilla planifolia TaxID=51239 RepID=A0A835VGJ3_VANPL|nr:hypothetical protein HPP92_000362 [Vanilla planifolia]